LRRILEQGSANSAHLRELRVKIRCGSSIPRYRYLDSLRSLGMTKRCRSLDSLRSLGMTEKLRSLGMTPLGLRVALGAVARPHP